MSIYRYFLPNGYFPGGAYIFADLERLSQEDLTKVKALCAMINESKSAVRILNDPRHILLRYDVLRTLYEQGINDFNVYRLIQDSSPRKYPVFFRYENDHNGPISALIQNEQELAYAIREARELGYFTSRVLMVEFSNTADEKGILQKIWSLCCWRSCFPEKYQLQQKLDDKDLLPLRS